MLNHGRVGKAYAIADIITVKYFYPLGWSTMAFLPEADKAGPDGLTGDISEVSRPLKEGETMEWALVSGVSRLSRGRILSDIDRI